MAMEAKKTDALSSKKIIGRDKEGIGT